MRPDLLSAEDGVPSVMDRRVLVRVCLLVAVHLHLDVAEEFLWRKDEKLRLQPLVARLVVPTTMEETHELPHLIVAELHLLFFLRTGWVSGRGQLGSGATHL